MKSAAERAAEAISKMPIDWKEQTRKSQAQIIISREYAELEKAARAIDEVIGDDDRIVEGGGKLGVYLTYQQILDLRSALAKARGTKRKTHEKSKCC